MVDVKHKRCVHEGCTTRPYFGIKGERASRCAMHKEPDMVDVVHKRCAHPGCTKQPVFGIEGERESRCALHKEPDMVDVKNKQCVHEGCIAHPSFGIEGERASHCVVHKDPGMVDVKHERCVREGCTKQPSCGIEGSRKRTHCEKHKTTGMIDVINPRCGGPGDDVPCPVSDRACHKGMCYACAAAAGLKRSRKLTETRCLKAIRKTLGAEATVVVEQLHVSFACSDVVGTCAYVDAYLSFPTVRICLEIDELAHCRRGYSCDERRMENVRGELLTRGGDDDRPIAWVRFNPDETDGLTGAAAKVQKRRCKDAVAAIRELVSNPREDVVYVNFQDPAPADSV